jgi:DNA-binding MarR family transcriptional regulator
MQSEIKLVKAGKKPGNDSQVLFLLSVINKGVGRYLEKQVKAQIDPALSTSHADILLYLRLHGPTTISQLQRFLGVTKSTMTALIAKLEAFE